jgi:hypothetical protein
VGIPASIGLSGVQCFTSTACLSVQLILCHGVVHRAYTRYMSTYRQLIACDVVSNTDHGVSLPWACGGVPAYL